MGYVKDNFPGSPAFYFRRKVCLSLTAASVSVGFLLFTFCKFPREQRAAIKEGLYEQPQWYKERIASVGGHFLENVPIYTNKESKEEGFPLTPKNNITTK